LTNLEKREQGKIVPPTVPPPQNDNDKLNPLIISIKEIYNANLRKEAKKLPGIESSPFPNAPVITNTSTKLIPFQTGKPKQKKSKNTTRASNDRKKLTCWKKPDKLTIYFNNKSFVFDPGKPQQKYKEARKP